MSKDALSIAIERMEHIRNTQRDPLMSAYSHGYYAGIQDAIDVLHKLERQTLDAKEIK